MHISQKCYYALMAMFELAKQKDLSPLPMSTVAKRNGISLLFLHMIMRELKQGGFVESRRGKEGGYVLARKPAEIKIGEIIRFIDGETELVDCKGVRKTLDCDRIFSCPFCELWQEATRKINEIFDGVTFQDMVEKERARIFERVLDYSI